MNANRMTTSLPTTPTARAETIRRRLLLAAIVSVTIVGFYLRYRCLGCLGFRWDEDLTSLAVKALLDKGVPELPSGMIYLRFYPYQWIVAASVKIFGFSEFSMRLPAVVFGTMLIPVSYYVGKKVHSEQAGLIVAACIAVSFWQVEMARTARMYAPFFLVYLVGAYAIFRVHYQDRERIFSVWVIPLAFLALSLHQLAYSLAILLLLAIPLRPTLARSVSLVAQAAVIGVAFIVLKSVEEHFFYLARGASDSGGSGPIAALLQQISLPDIRLASTVWTDFPVIAAVIVAVVLLASWRFCKADCTRQGVAYRLLTIAAVVLALAHLFNLVAIALALMLVALKDGIRSLRHPAWYRPALVCLSLFVLWLGAVLAIDTFATTAGANELPSLRKLLRTLVDYPNFRLFWSYALERPLLALPLALGILWGIDRIARDRPDATALFVVGGFWSVIFVNSVLQTKFEFFRYNLQLDPIFLIMVVSGLFAIPGLLASLGLRQSPHAASPGPRPLFVAAVATFAIVGVNPAAAWFTSSRDYSETSFPYTVLGLETYEDFKTPAEYVRDRLRDEDIVLVLAPREYWNYIGRVDYWLWNDIDDSQTYLENGQPHDLYVGVPVLVSPDEVRSAIADHPSGTTWILYSRARIARTKSISSDLKAYLQGLEGDVVYVGRDRQTVVIRIDPRGDPG